MRYVENVVIGMPICEPKELLSSDVLDWETIESEKTYFTTERYLPRILVELGIYPSVSEIKRNKPELMITLNELDFIRIKATKKRMLWVLVGR